jgi:hypothetical protein
VHSIIESMRQSAFCVDPQRDRPDPTDQKLFGFQDQPSSRYNMASTGNPFPPLPPQVAGGSRAPLMFGVQSVLMALVLLSYVMRIYSRARPSPHFSWDDYIITLSVVSTKEKHILQYFVALTIGSYSHASVSVYIARTYPMDMATICYQSRQLRWLQS